MKQIIALFVLFYGVSCETPSCDLDVAFLIDSSGSMTPTGFDQEKDFVKRAAKELGVAPGKSRAAVIQFAITATEKIGFKEVPTLAEFESAVNGIKYRTEGSRTRIDNGLSKAKEVFEKVRSSDRIKLLLLLTDGKQPNVDEKLKQLSSELRNASVQLLAVGIGSGVDVEQLKLIAGDDANAITATDFNHLKNKLGSLVKKACACPVNVAFILDVSGSITDVFLKEKEVVLDLTKDMNIGGTDQTNTSKVALMHFSHLPTIDGLFGEYATTSEFQGALKALPFIGKQTRIDRALSKASSEIFKTISISHPNIAVVFTDGVQTLDTVTEIPKGLRDASQPLKDKGVRVIAVGVTANANRERLRLMTDRWEDVVVNKDKAVLVGELKVILKNACKPMPTKLPGDIETCKDTNPLCARYGTPDYCRQHPDDMAVRCPKTCNMCPY